MVDTLFRPLPWHQAVWDTLLDARRQERLFHAMLLGGPAGLGKAQFATNLAWSLLCAQPNDDGTPCQQCKSCHLLRAETHPDIIRLTPEAPGKPIKIDQIRQLLNFAGMTAQYTRHKIICLNPAEAMNENAANALLKLLEEPPAQTLLLLLAHQPALLMPTIRSRCQQFDFSRLDSDSMLGWLRTELPAQDAELLLALSGNAPLRAIEIAEKLPVRQQVFGSLEQLLNRRTDPVSTAADWMKVEDWRDVLAWLTGWLMDLIRCRAGSDQLQNRDMAEPLQTLSAHFAPQKLFELYDLHLTHVRLLNEISGLRQQGMMETLAIAWRQARG